MDTFMSGSAEYETLQMSLYILTKKHSNSLKDQKMMEAEFQRQLTLYIVNFIHYKHSS